MKEKSQTLQNQQNRFAYHNCEHDDMWAQWTRESIPQGCGEGEVLCGLRQCVGHNILAHRSSRNRLKRLRSDKLSLCFL